MQSEGLGAIPHFALGGTQAPWFARSEAREIYHPGGLLHSNVPGRTDRLPISVAADSHVIPADAVSAAGQGNSMAGANILQAALKFGPYGTSLGKSTGHRMGPPRAPAASKFAHGGKTPRIPILAAGGEVIVPPEAVFSAGGGDMKKGHRVIDELIKRLRTEAIKFMRHAPAPKK